MTAVRSSGANNFEILNSNTDAIATANNSSNSKNKNDITTNRNMDNTVLLAITQGERFVAAPGTNGAEVKDLRTNYETSATQKVLDGDLDQFIEASLKQGVWLPTMLFAVSAYNGDTLF